MSVINMEAGNSVENGNLVSVGSDGKVYGIDYCGSINAIGCDVSEDGTVNVLIRGNVSLYLEPNLLLNINKKEYKINIKNNIEIAKDRLNAII